jgi:AcrR family transcriptional regulator
MCSVSIVPLRPADVASTARAFSAPRARQGPLDQNAVLGAALEIVDQEGLAALTIRRLADDLGVPLATIQATIGRKENILRGLVELMLSDVELTSDEEGSQRDALTELLDRVHLVFMSHPAVAQLAVLQRVTGPKALDLQERILSLLRGGDLSDAGVVTAFTMIASYLAGFTLLRISRGEFESETGEPQLDVLLRQMPPHDYPTLRALSPALKTQTSAARFREGLNELLHDLL